jgi:hypothetical protein
MARRWSRWHLRSKYKKAQIEKMERGAGFGTGGRSKKDHAKLTAAGIAKHREKGLGWGPTKKATPELIQRAKEMLRDGVKLGEVCKTLGVSHHTLNVEGVYQRALKKEGKLRDRLAAEN